MLWTSDGHWNNAKKKTNLSKLFHIFYTNYSFPLKRERKFVKDQTILIYIFLTSNYLRQSFPTQSCNPCIHPMSKRHVMLYDSAYLIAFITILDRINTTILIMTSWCREVRFCVRTNLSIIKWIATPFPLWRSDRVLFDCLVTLSNITVVHGDNLLCVLW